MGSSHGRRWSIVPTCAEWLRIRFEVGPQGCRAFHPAVQDPDLKTLLSGLVPTTTSTGQSLSAHQQAFCRVLLGIAVVAGLVHVGFMAMMAWADVRSLVVGNAASVLTYVLMFQLARRGQLRGSLIAGGFEVVAHAVVATWVIGWASGFHYYILLTLPILIMSTVVARADKLVGVPLFAVIVLALDVHCRQRVPEVSLDTAILNTLHFFNLISCMAILVFMSVLYLWQIQGVEKQLRAMATTDPLTQLNNRRALLDVIQHEERRLHRGRQTLSFVMADIDHFKQINDNLGHEVGDQVLRKVSQALAAGVRDVDHLARWGGEEFLVVLPDTDEVEATQVAERLRQAVGSVSLKDRAVSMTFGVSEVRGDESAEQAISRADAAMYEGKRTGRNRVVRAARRVA
jgi:diguanylate cyclase (GGDEF)-like protein